MSIGPVESLTIRFPASGLDGQIAEELRRLIAAGTIRILDLIFLTKGADGLAVALERDSLDEAAAAITSLKGTAGGLLTDEDLAAAAEVLPPGSSGLFIVWEDRWAAPLATALRAAGGEIVGGGRVPHETMVAALDRQSAAG